MISDIDDTSRGNNGAEALKGRQSTFVPRFHSHRKEASMHCWIGIHIGSSLAPGRRLRQLNPYIVKVLHHPNLAGQKAGLLDERPANS